MFISPIHPNKILQVPNNPTTEGIIEERTASGYVQHLSSKRISINNNRRYNGYALIEITYSSNSGRAQFYDLSSTGNDSVYYGATNNQKTTRLVNLYETRLSELGIIICNISTSTDIQYEVNITFINYIDYETISNSSRYFERRLTISAGESYEFYIDFENDGYKTLTTFGGYNTEITLCDAFDNVLATGGNNGIDGHAFLSYNIDKHVLYKIKVTFDDSNHSGITKLVLLPMSQNFANIESIPQYSVETTRILTGTLDTNEAFIFRYYSTETESVNFAAICAFDSYVYILDTFASQAITSQPDSFSSYKYTTANNYNDDITKELDGYVEYIIVLCPQNPTTSSGTYNLHITIM
ncbi:MAG: hypothetical protein E7678_08020 [Ruminococcaceae bacterium]|nr:hypothetical protein [Oscillospiraceae bacterium]